jgi:putative ABC transport system permease protein
MFMVVRLAARNLAQSPRRTGLLATALSLVSLLLVVLLTLAQGMSDTLVDAATLLSSGHVNVAGFYKVKPSSWTPLVTHAQALRKLVADNTTGVDYILDRGRGWAKVVSETQSLQVVLAGIDAREEGRLLHHLRGAQQSDYLDNGRAEVLGHLSSLNEPQALLLFAGQARRLGVDIGDMVTLTAEMPGGQTNTAEGKVAFIAQDLGFLSNFTLFVPKQIIWQLGQFSQDTTGSVMVYLKDPQRATQVMQHLRGVLSKAGFTLMDHLPQPYFTKFEMVGGEDWTGQKIDLTTWEDEMGLMRWSLSALQSISFLLVSILLAMIAVGITNSMFIAVRERTQEIGTLRAIGMGKGPLAALFVLEALLLGAGATTVGACLGALLAYSVDAAAVPITLHALRVILMSNQLHLAVRATQVVSAILTITGVTALAAVWPALQAAKLQPMTAINRLG